MKIALGVFLAVATLAAGAQTAAPAPGNAPAARASAADSATPGQPGEARRRTAEPAVQREVIEDDGVRIEELKVRGETRRVVVQSKVPGARPYEILPGGGGRDPHEDRSAGRRVWQLFSF